jgi:hypothetical protein
MAAPVLTINATLQCPHGAPVQIISSNTKLMANGAPVALATDTFVVAGCPFTLPGPKPSPCVTVRWTVTDTKTSVGGAATLSMASAGMCYSAEQAAQGPVVKVSTPAMVETT